MYTYRQILQQAFRAAVQYPVLWVFGLFLALMGGSGDIGFLLSSYNFSADSAVNAFFNGLAAGGLFTIQGMRGIAAAMFQSPVYFFALSFILLIIAALTVVIVWLIMVSQSAVISQVIALSKNKTVSFSDGFAVGIKKFWPVIGLNALLRVAVWLLFVGLTYLAVIKIPNVRLWYVLVFDIAWILVLILSFIIKYAICGVVLKNGRFTDSVRTGWKLFITNWVLSLEVAIMLFLVYAGINMLLFFFLGVVLLFALKLYAGFQFGIIVILTILGVGFVLLEAILALFQWATWAIIFELMVSRKFTILNFLRNGFKTFSH